MRTILVEDEPDILEEIKAMVEKYGDVEIVGIYTEPLEAIKQVSVTKPDWALLNIEMAGMSGIELAERLLVLNLEIKVLFITAYNYYAA
jgi:two-component SAPR family response regulator